MIKCLNCQKETRNIKYCSHSCAAIVNNENVRRHKPSMRTCKHCLTMFVYTKSTKYYRYCNVCYDIVEQEYEENIKRLLNLTLGDFRRRLKGIKKNGPPSLAMTMVRGYNRIWNAHMLKACQICGYNKHVELAHVKPLASFPDETLIIDVNSEENIRGLCPNHHWELDAGLISAENIPVLKRGITIEEMVKSSMAKSIRYKKYKKVGRQGTAPCSEV